MTTIDKAKSSININKHKHYLSIGLGILVMAFAIHFFLIPSKLVLGGVNGLAVVIHEYIPTMSTATIILIANAILYVLALIVLGKAFVLRSIFTTSALTGLLLFFERAFPVTQPLSDDLMINMVFGAVLVALGLGTIMYNNATTGGTDIIAMILNKLFHIDIGKAQFLIDSLVVLSAVLTFGLNLGLYAIVGIFIVSNTIDRVIEGYDRKYEVEIMSTKTEEIRDYILNTLNKGLSVVDAHGGYSKEKRYIISSILSKQEFIKLKYFIETVDHEAYFTVTIVSKVFGEELSYIGK